MLALLRRLQLPGAALAALLFAVHPVGVESVAWITQRKALLSTLLFLVSLVGWLRFTASGAARWYLFTSAAFLLALMAKTTTVMFPVVLVLLHGYQQQPWTRRAVLRLAPFFAMALVAGVTSIVFERFIGSTGEAWSASLAERVAAAGMITWFYLGKLILPLGLSFNYPRWQIDASAVSSYLPSAAVVAFAVLLWWFRSGWARPWILALGCFLVNLFPVLGFLDVYGMRYAHVADHWQYLAGISILALEAGLIASTPRWIARAWPGLEAAARAACTVLCAAGVAALAWLTWQQAGAYVDGVALWRHTLERQPGSLIANNNLGTLLLDGGRPAEAIPYFRKAIEADPTLPEGYLNLGNALDAGGERAQAPVYWRKVLEIDPAQPVALHNLAVWDMNGGRLGEAEALLVRALEVDPRFDPALQKLGRIYRRQGRPEAIAPFVSKATPALFGREPDRRAPARARRLVGDGARARGLRLGRSQRGSRRRIRAGQEAAFAARRSRTGNPWLSSEGSAPRRARRRSPLLRRLRARRGGSGCAGSRRRSRGWRARSRC